MCLTVNKGNVNKVWILANCLYIVILQKEITMRSVMNVLLIILEYRFRQNFHSKVRPKFLLVALFFFFFSHFSIFLWCFHTQLFPPSTTSVSDNDGDSSNVLNKMSQFDKTWRIVIRRQAINQMVEGHGT